MTTHCKEGDKPVVNYSFNGSKRVFRSGYAPIEIETKTIPVEVGEEYQQEGYRININSVNGGNTSALIVAHEFIDTSSYPNIIFPGTAFPYGGKFLTVMYCGQTTYQKRSPCNDAFNQSLGCRIHGFNLNPGSFTVDATQKCPTKNDERCSIIIKYKGIIIHQAQGDCPINYSVQCGKCPEGQHECESKQPPFYCCTDCAGTANKINNLAGKYR